MVEVDAGKIHEFADAAAFENWLARNHGSEDELWIRIHKKGSGLPSITPREAVDVVLCWGWIDAIRKSWDERSFLQRYTPRRRKSLWSKVNVDNVERMIAAGRMTEHGLREVAAAKADGRWARAYGSGSGMAIPPDLLAAIEADPAARETLATLTAQNRFALAFRMHQLRTEKGRRDAVARFVAMLARGETPHPQGKREPGSGSRS